MGAGMPSLIDAQWVISLTAECPGCNEQVELTEDPDFWVASEVEPCEHNTERSQNLEVTCPKCDRIFFVNCVY